MAKLIYFSLLLLVLCLSYEVYGNLHMSKFIRLPSHKIYNDGGLYGSSSSSSSTTGTKANGAEDDAAAAALSPSFPLKKSFGLSNSLGYNRNGGSGLNSKFLNDKRYGQQSNYMDLDNLFSEKLQNSMNSRFLNNKPLVSDLYNRNNGIDKKNGMASQFPNSRPLNGLYNINNQNDKTSEELNINKRQNSIISDSQNFPNLIKTKINPLARQKTLSPFSNEDDSQQISDGNDHSTMMNIMNSITKPLNGQIMIKSFRECCINGECRMLQEGEECSAKYFKNMKTNQDPNNPMSITSTNGAIRMNEVLSKLMNKKLKPFGQNSFNSLGDVQETEKPTDMRLDLMGYSKSIPFIGSSNGMGSYITSENRDPVNYSQSVSEGLEENEIKKIRDQVLEKSNLYRQKYNLKPFTLDDQINNCAQDWANQIANTGKMSHREDNAYGENIYASSNFNDLGSKAVEAWYNEITKFNIADNENELVNNNAIHHMTQLLWKSSEKLGVGISKSHNGMYNVVANYDPVGNVVGFFKENLPNIKQKDIDEVASSQNSQAESKESIWSSSSTSPFQSEEWEY